MRGLSRCHVLKYLVNHETYNLMSYYIYSINFDIIKLT